MDTSPRTLQGQWEHLRKASLPAELSVSELLKYKTIYFAGASALLNCVVSAKQVCGGEQSVFSAIMKDREQELAKVAIESVKALLDLALQEVRS